MEEEFTLDQFDHLVLLANYHEEDIIFITNDLFEFLASLDIIDRINSDGNIEISGKVFKKLPEGNRLFFIKKFFPLALDISITKYFK